MALLKLHFKFIHNKLYQRRTFFSNNEHDNSEIESQIDNFGVSFIFERALRRLDVQTEQRRLQQDKFDGRLKQLENDNLVLEQRLTNKNRDFDKLKDKFGVIQVAKYLSQ